MSNINPPAAPSVAPGQSDPAAPRAFYLVNHVAHDLQTAALADLPKLSQQPAFAEKAQLRFWSHQPTTRHVFYTMAEPQQPAMRSSGRNPVKYLHGLVADYDGPAAYIQEMLRTLRFDAGRAPTWVTTTFSGKARLIWAFPQRVPVFAPEVLMRFVKLLARSLKLTELLPGLDEGALTNPHTPYELGRDWRQPYGDVRLSPVLISHALHEACNKMRWPSKGLDIPFDAIAEEVERRWPGRWAGPMEEGARGLRFWDPRADNPTGCTLRAAGVQAWSGEARFIPWSELLGADFVRKYEESRIGGAIEGIHFDGHHYWLHGAEGAWKHCNTEAVKRHLASAHGLSALSKQGRPSEITAALATIERFRRVDGAFPCLYDRRTLVQEHTHTYLNISRVQPLAPAQGMEGADQPDRTAWGEGFPWLAEYFTGLLDAEQRTVLFSWMAHFYRRALRGEPRGGQALFLAGPAGAGKTFFSQAVLGGLMGGFEDASDLLLGRSQFTEALFYAPVWAIDDGVASAHQGKHDEYSQMVKKIVANMYQTFHAKFHKAVSLRFNGRLVVTLNDDAQALAMLPKLEASLLDKVILLRVQPPSVSFVGVADRLKAELPALAAWLQHYEIPAQLRTRSYEVDRFGLDAWHHPDLVQHLQEASDAHSAREYVLLWRAEHFRQHPGVVEWHGNVTELLVALLRHPAMARNSGWLTRTRLCRDLHQLMRSGASWLHFRRTADQRIYTILRPRPEEIGAEAGGGGPVADASGLVVGEPRSSGTVTPMPPPVNPPGAPIQLPLSDAPAGGTPAPGGGAASEDAAAWERLMREEERADAGEEGEPPATAIPAA